jgi:hypothetical protein
MQQQRIMQQQPVMQQQVNLMENGLIYLCSYQFLYPQPSLSDVTIH